jgi:hypothetical protein
MVKYHSAYLYQIVKIYKYLTIGVEQSLARVGEYIQEVPQFPQPIIIVFCFRVYYMQKCKECLESLPGHKSPGPKTMVKGAR